MPSHYLNQCLLIVKWTPRNKLQCNFDQNTKFFIHENAFEHVVCQNGGHSASLADDIFNRIFLNKNGWISITILLNSIPKNPIDNKPALVQVMAWHRTGDKPLHEPVLTQFIDVYAAPRGDESKQHPKQIATFQLKMNISTMTIDKSWAKVYQWNKTISK